MCHDKIMSFCVFLRLLLLHNGDSFGRLGVLGVVGVVTGDARDGGHHDLLTLHLGPQLYRD